MEMIRMVAGGGSNLFDSANYYEYEGAEMRCVVEA